MTARTAPGATADPRPGFSEGGNNNEKEGEKVMYGLMAAIWAENTIHQARREARIARADLELLWDNVAGAVGGWWRGRERRRHYLEMTLDGAPGEAYDGEDLWPDGQADEWGDAPDDNVNGW